MEKKHLTVVSFLMTLLFSSFGGVIRAQTSDWGITLYATYTSRSVMPGKTLSYSIEVINNTNHIQDIGFNLVGVPDSWNSTLTVNSNSVQRIAVKPKTDEEDHSKSIDLDLEIPLKIEKGTYYFKVIASSENGYQYELPLRIKVTEQGVLETKLQVDQANMEGYVDDNFNYNVTLKNRTAQKQSYALTSEAPQGWGVRFQVAGDYVTSVSLPSNKTKNIMVKVEPSPKTNADTYDIKIAAMSGSTSAKATLEAVIKGKYDLKLSTPSGRLSAEVTAGGAETIKLSLKNTGTVPLHNIELSASTPVDWEVDFSNKTISRLATGSSTTVEATIKATNKAIAGDYRLQISADTPEISSDATFRITVSKSILWGSAGILVIVLVVGGIAYLFKKYGRR